MIMTAPSGLPGSPTSGVPPRSASTKGGAPFTSPVPSMTVPPAAAIALRVRSWVPRPVPPMLTMRSIPSRLSSARAISSASSGRRTMRLCSIPAASRSACRYTALLARRQATGFFGPMVISLPVARIRILGVRDTCTSSMHASLKSAVSRTPSLVPFLRITSPRLLSAPRRRTCRSEATACRAAARSSGLAAAITASHPMGIIPPVLIHLARPLFRGSGRVPFKSDTSSISR